MPQNVWQLPEDHNRHDNLHDPSPKTRGNLPRTTIDTITYMIHAPKRVTTSRGPQSTRQLTWSMPQNVWQPPTDHNRHDNLHDPSPKTCGNLPRTTIDTTTYMIHRPKRVATSQWPQSSPLRWRSSWYVRMHVLCVGYAWYVCTVRAVCAVCISTNQYFIVRVTCGMCIMSAKWGRRLCMVCVYVYSEKTKT